MNATAETVVDGLDQPAEHSQPDAAGAEDTGANSPDNSQDAQPRNRVQERIDELTGDKHRLKGHLEFTQDELASARQRIAELEGRAPAEEPEETVELLTKPTPPELDAFDGDYSEFSKAQTKYSEDLVEYNLQQREIARQEQKRTEAAQRKTQDAQKARIASWNEKANRGIEKYPDFQEVALTKQLPVTEAMGEAMIDADNGEEVLYFLGKNPERAHRIAQMTATQAAIEIGKISGQLETQPGDTVNQDPNEQVTDENTRAGNKVSSAPPPNTPVKSTGSPERDPSKMSQAEYNEWRRNGGGK